jgi:hypothetical protein
LHFVTHLFIQLSMGVGKMDLDNNGEGEWWAKNIWV